jgi:hypothetical protein
MIKLNILCSIACALAIALSACTSKKHGDHEIAADTDEWKPMDDFHMIMAESFHPFRDSADLGPAKANADAMMGAAETWLNAPIPEKVNNDEIKARLQELRNEAATFATISKTDDNEAIGESLTKLHDLFHGLQEEWYGGHEEHTEHH